MILADTRARPSDLYITDQLYRRAVPEADHLREIRALQELAGRMLDTPKDVLPRFVELAMQITGGISAGLSLYEEHPEPGVFRWRYLTGVLKTFEDALTPRNYSPCGVTLDASEPVLSRHPERFYSWISDAGIVVPEVLLVPLHFAGAEPIGTLWIVAEDEGHFHAGHARAAAELAHFAGIAVRVLESREQLQSALERQEVLTREMAHRVNNLFAVVQSLVQLTARTSTSVADMTEALLGRLTALSRAHALVRKSFGAAGTEHSHQFDDLLRTIIEPHENRSSGPSRFTVAGPPIALGKHALDGLALVFHELTTNAVKYGALASPDGRLDIHWSETVDGKLAIFWNESGGREIEETPELNGFGSQLLRDTIKRQFGGTLDKTWVRSGLAARIELPLKKLAY